MKILNLIGGGDVGGAKTHIISLASRLSRYCQVKVVSFRDGPFVEDTRAAGVDVEVVQNRNPLRDLHALRRIVETYGPDVIHCHGARANMMGVLLKRWVQIPACLQGELIKFSRRQGICSGPLFRTRTGRPLGRTNVSDAIRALCRDANIAPEKGNPRCLRKLYLETRESIQAGLQLLAEQTYDSLLEREQLSVGWEDF